MTVMFDTLKLAQELRKDAGFTPEQAEGLARALSQASAENLATKADIAELRAEIANIKVELLKWFIPLLTGQAAFIIAMIKLL